ncbi:hypothetical protein N8T08_005014 [Aspergillus melleus]|uniref:Uncharacterized protein n=1 Tax=Aspergillus melleus TaxID=138277 RepID=A0ACC3B3I0_9EURO|nr:hypothetical protein N8T08_005014 [Aspergillus melleus]
MRWPWGAERIVRILRFRGDILDGLVSPSFYRTGAWTIRATIPLVLQPLMLVAEPANVKAVLSTSFADWGVGPRRLKQFGPFLGLGIFTADGHSWSSARGTLRPVFSRHQVSDLEFTSRHVDRLLDCLGGSEDATPAGAWTEWVDAMPLVYRFTMDAATEFLFGESVDSQLRPGSASDRRNAFEQAFEASSLGVGGRMRLGSFYWVLNHAGFRRACQLCRTYVAGFVDRTLGLPYEKEKKSQRGLFLRQLSELTQDRVLIRDQLLQLLFAGRDTTATLISFALLSLARDPAAWSKLRAEVFAHSANSLSFESLKSCSYLQAVLSETLRLYPPIPINTRQALRDTVLPVGGGPHGDQPVAVPKGTTLTYSVYVMHRRTDIWGENAAEWCPDRWQGLKGGFHYLPFNAGPRHCPGQQFALTEAAYTLARLAQSFDRIECLDPTQRIQKTLGITILPSADRDQILPFATCILLHLLMWNWLPVDE